MVCFHREAFGLGFAVLPMNNGLGVRYSTVSDEVTGISMRARMWDNGATATTSVALDVLYGGEVLNGQLATRILRPSTVLP